MDPVDPRRHGIAPDELVVGDDGDVYMTLAGLMRRLAVSESTIRRNTGLMALRRAVGPNTFRWRKADVDAYLAEQGAIGKAQRRDVRRVLTAGRGRTGRLDGAHRGRKRDSALREIMEAKLANYPRGT